MAHERADGEIGKGRRIDSACDEAQDKKAKEFKRSFRNELRQEEKEDSENDEIGILTLTDLFQKLTEAVRTVRKRHSRFRGHVEHVSHKLTDRKETTRATNRNRNHETGSQRQDG